MDDEANAALQQGDRDIDVVVDRLNLVTARFTALEFITERFIAKHFAALSHAEVLNFISETVELGVGVNPDDAEGEAAIAHRLRRILERTNEIRASAD